MASPIQRVDNAIASGLGHANLGVQNVFTCLQRNLNNAVTSKTQLGDKLGLGMYMKPRGTQAKTDRKDLRNQIRACLLMRLTIGGATYSRRQLSQEKTRLKRLTAVQLNQEMTQMQVAGPQHTPTTIHTTSLASGTYPDHIQHDFNFSCTSGNLLHVAHVATREFVTYLVLKNPNAIDQPIAIYGSAANFPSGTHGPWFPNAAASQPGPGWPSYKAPPNPTVMGPYQNIFAGGTDNHSFGPYGPPVETGGHLGMIDGGGIRECTLYAEQEYQYNGTCDPATWSRDGHPGATLTNSAVHANDQHWVAFPTNSRWIIERRIYQDDQTGHWMIESTKRGNEPSNLGTRFTRSSRLLAEDGQPFDAA